MAGKGIPTTYPMKANFPGHVLCSGSFRPNGATGVVSGSVKGNGFTVARTSAGLYTVTFDTNHSFPKKVSVLTGVRAADGTPTIVQGGDYSEANRTLQLRVMQAAPSAAAAKGIIPLPLGAFQEQSGVALADFVNASDPTPGWSGGDESNGIRWNNDANPDPVATQFVWPQDLDESVNATLHIIAAKVGATLADAVTWTVELFNNVVGALYDADANYGGNSSEMTGDAATKTVQDVVRTLVAANLPTGPAVSTLTIQPTDGTLGTDDVILLGAYIEYQRSGGSVWALADLTADVDAEVSFAVVVDNDLVAG